jgi:hypothetical protein
MLVLLLLNPTRPLVPIFVILGLAVLCWLAPILLPGDSLPLAASFPLRSIS